MNTLAYFYGPWYLTDFFCVRCSGILDIRSCSSSTEELTSARAAHSKILDIISFAFF